jgi:hypothetical protein
MFATLKCLDINDLRVYVMQSGAKDLLMLLLKEVLQILRYAQDGI